MCRCRVLPNDVSQLKYAKIDQFKTANISTLKVWQSVPSALRNSKFVLKRKDPRRYFSIVPSFSKLFSFI